MIFFLIRSLMGTRFIALFFMTFMAPSASAGAGAGVSSSSFSSSFSVASAIYNLEGYKPKRMNVIRCSVRNAALAVLVQEEYRIIHDCVKNYYARGKGDESYAAVKKRFLEKIACLIEEDVFMAITLYNNLCLRLHNASS